MACTMMHLKYLYVVMCSTGKVTVLVQALHYWVAYGVLTVMIKFENYLKSLLFQKQ